jgi:hypothetical protein
LGGFGGGGGGEFDEDGWEEADDEGGLVAEEVKEGASELTAALVALLVSEPGGGLWACSEGDPWIFLASLTEAGAEEEEGARERVRGRAARIDRGGFEAIVRREDEEREAEACLSKDEERGSIFGICKMQQRTR